MQNKWYCSKKLQDIPDKDVQGTDNKIQGPVTKVKEWITIRFQLYKERF